MIDDLTQMQGIVLANGGGVVKNHINRKHLAERGVVVHLDCPLQNLLDRTRKDKKRPLLQGDNREQILANLLKERAPLYAEIADYRFVSNKQSARVLTNQIRRKLTEEKII